MIKNHFVQWIDDLRLAVKKKPEPLDRFPRLALFQRVDCRFVSTGKTEFDNCFIPAAARVHRIE
jgi:hypothetical protein